MTRRSVTGRTSTTFDAGTVDARQNAKVNSKIFIGTSLAVIIYFSEGGEWKKAAALKGSGTKMHGLVVDADVSTIVVVGGGSGVGLAVADMALSRGFERVVITGRNQERLKSVADSRPGVGFISFDGADESSAREAFQSVGTINHLVTTASGNTGAGPFETLDLNEVRRGWEAKVMVQITAVQAALPFIAEHGSITLVGAASSRCANPGTAGLAAINASLDAIVPTLARELAPRRVNLVSPGVIETTWWDQFGDRKTAILEQYSERSPVKRNGTPEDVADAILFLAGNGFVTGVVLDCDGGLRLT
jgi:NAD(P)-dependent dehydrogenase (short-subunit alcohol dehydrogenase family)